MHSSFGKVDDSTYPSTHPTPPTHTYTYKDPVKLPAALEGLRWGENHGALRITYLKGMKLFATSTDRQQLYLIYTGTLNIIKQH